jgi:hypothetical protein
MDDDNDLQTVHIPMTQRQMPAAQPLITALLRNSVIHTYRWTADTNQLEIQYPRQNATAAEASSDD